MRRRITLIQKPDTLFTPDQATLTRDALSIRYLDAFREERVTLSFDELTPDLQNFLKQTHQVHIRWATERGFDTLAPFSSRVSPGLHVFLGRGDGGSESGEEELLCPWLKRVFGDEVECLNSKTSFTSPPILSRLSSPANLHYHTLLPSPANLITYLQETICLRATGPKAHDCQRYAASLSAATSIDLGYDSISHAMTMAVVWPSAPGDNGWTDTIGKPVDGDGDQVEVGLLGHESASDAEDLKMGGLLGVVGRDEELKPTLFSFPSRHHPLPDDAMYSVSFPHPTGLHPTMTLSLSPSSLNPPPAPADAACALHTYLTLPSLIFGDKYQLSTTDPLFLNSHHLAALRAVFGETDLEAPDWAVGPWGSNWLFELATPEGSEKGQEEWNVTIPLHLRYLRPSKSGYRTAEVPWPVVFWACTAEGGTKMGINPFDRVNLGWEGLFGPKTMFYQIHPSSGGGDTGSRLVAKIEVPVLQLNEKGIFANTKTIELGTVIVILLGFGWVLWKLGVVLRSSSSPGRKDKQGKTE